MLYAVRLPGSGGGDAYLDNLRLRGISGLITRDNPVLDAYLRKHPDYQTFYIEVGEGRAELVKDWELGHIRDYSAFRNLLGGLAKRLLTVRTEWSRK
jgi:hypothetical protein